MFFEGEDAGVLQKGVNIMVRKQHIQYLSNDHITLIHAVQWVPEGDVRAILQISHGMVEFVERYEEFAQYLAKKNILVVGNDHLGHGESVRSKEDYGYFAEENGNGILVQDIHRLRKMMQEDYPDTPYFLLGHSMGSFLVRQYLCCYGQGLSGAIVMGTGDKTKILVRSGMLICQMLAKVKGWRHRSAFVNKMAFGSYSKGYKNPRTDKDWLTKDEKIVDAYIKDERCSFLFTLNAYYNMFLGLHLISSESYLKKMPKKLPVFFVSGGDDPVGDRGKGVLKVYSRFKQMGMKNLKYRLFPGDRHEILNEVDRGNVFEELYNWLTECLECYEKAGGK